jgi:hypothetical protein
LATSENGQGDDNTFFSAMISPLMAGGYTSLLLRVDQETSTALKLHFDEAHNKFRCNWTCNNQFS